MPLSAVLLALALGALSSLAVACGDTSELLSERGAARLTNDVDRVAEAVQAGDCEATAVRLQELQSEVADLPSSVSSGLRRNLADGVAQLATQAAEECQGEQAETVPTEQVPPPEVETTETTEEPEPTETTETETTPAEPPAEPEPEPEAPEQTPTTTQPAPEPAPGGAGEDGAAPGAQGDAGTGGVGAGDGTT